MISLDMKPLKVSLLIDNPRSWYRSYGEKLAAAITAQGHAVTVVQTSADLPEGDVAFFLSCEEIISAALLKRHTHNIVIHASRVPEGKGWSPMRWQIVEGKNTITVSLFEATEKVDSGDVYDTEEVRFDGSELIGELREKEAAAIEALALRFLTGYPGTGTPQSGTETFYPKRSPKDSELDPNKTIAEQFDILRVVDSERYPAFFKHRGHTYVIKIEKKDA